MENIYTDSEIVALAKIHADSLKQFKETTKKPRVRANRSLYGAKVSIKKKLSK